MSDSPSIPRRSRDADPTDFETLRSEAIRWLERLGSDQWTDYNLHDPGITILEHLCFGLTDLLYRVGFDVEDHLTGPDGVLDYEGQGLYPPEDILPCRPTTPSDYRQTILACVEEVDDAWIRPWPWAGGDEAGQGGPGLMRILLRPSEEAVGNEVELLGKAHGILSAARNLGEDVDTVTVARRTPYHLVADVDIAGARPISEILTDIYRSAEDYVAGRPRPMDPEEEESWDEGLDDARPGRVPTGPVGCGGRRLVDDPDYDPRTLFLADLLSRIQAVEGVIGVRNLHLRRHEDGASEAEERVADVLPRYAPDQTTDGWTVPWLVTPGSELWDGDPSESSHGRVRLWRRGEPLAGPSSFTHRYRAARGGHRLDRRRGVGTAVRRDLPAGVHRNLGRYRSIQQHFPAIYGINQEGVPDSASEEEWTSAFRLKSFLLLPEQLLANYLANLAHLRSFFSLEEQGAGGRADASTYATQVVGPEEMPGFDRFYGEREAPDDNASGGFGPYHRDPGTHLARAVARHDDTVDRRSRLQDHMLAIYGESLAPRSSAEGDDQGALDEEPAWLVRSRARLLRDIPRATRDRGGGFDHLDPESTPSGFKRRVALLLGVRPEAPFRVVEHIQLRPVGEAVGREAWEDFYGLRVSVVFPGWGGRARDDDFRRRADEVVGAQCPAHVRADCYWLSRPRMEELVALDDAWRDARRSWLQSLPEAWAHGDGGDGRAVDDAASELVRFFWAEARGRGE